MHVGPSMQSGPEEKKRNRTALVGAIPCESEGTIEIDGLELRFASGRYDQVISAYLKHEGARKRRLGRNRRHEDTEEDEDEAHAGPGVR